MALTDASAIAIITGRTLLLSTQVPATLQPGASREIIISCTRLQHVARNAVDYRWDTYMEEKWNKKEIENKTFNLATMSSMSSTSSSATLGSCRTQQKELLLTASLTPFYFLS